MIKVESGKGEEIYLASPTEVIEKSIVVVFGEEFIEVPGVVVFQKSIELGYGIAATIASISDEIMSRIMHPLSYVVKIDEKDFEQLMEVIDIVKDAEKRITIDLPLRPKRTAMINFEAVKNSAILISISENTVIVNDFVFTTSKKEFHGNGMFTIKRSFFVQNHELEEIKKALSEILSS